MEAAPTLPGLHRTYVGVGVSPPLQTTTAERVVPVSHSHDITSVHESAIVWLLLVTGLLCAPTARRDPAQRCSESVTEPSGCLAYRLRREAFAYVRTSYAPMAYHPVGAAAWWLARPLFTPARCATRPTFRGAFPRRLLASTACDARADSPSKWPTQASPWQPWYGHVTPVTPTDSRGTPCYAMRRANTHGVRPFSGCHRVTGLFKGLGRVVAGGAGYEWPVKSQGSDVHFKRDVVTAAFGRGVNDD